MICTPTSDDGEKIREIAALTGMFTAEEVQCVADIWQQYLQFGIEASGYTFYIDKTGGEILGFVCVGPRSLTDRVFDLYWIAVNPAAQRQGVGLQLLQAAETAVMAANGRMMVIETSGSPHYSGTRAFYTASGYLHEATLRDLYADGDDLCIYTRRLDGHLTSVQSKNGKFSIPTQTKED